MEERRKFNYMNLLLILVFVVGLGILLYPNISDYFNRKNSTKSISEYDETVAKLNEEVRTQMKNDTDYYNRTLLNNPVGRFAEMTDKMKKEYMENLNVDGKGMMCYLKIEKLGLNQPVYHTTEEEVLQKYIGHIEGTSLPYGGKGTHCGLSGHRGLPSAVLFTNLDRMEVGDVFSIVVLGEEHFYQVDQIVTVLPNDMSPLAIDPEMDYVTLVTCTPYGENTHRLMIRGVRITMEEAEEIIPEQDDSEYGLTREQIVNIIAVVMAGIFTFVVIPILLFPVVPKRVVYLRPWDDNIEEVFQAAIKVSEKATRANWETEDVTTEADRLASMRRWDDTLKNPDSEDEYDSERPWEDYDIEGEKKKSSQKAKQQEEQRQENQQEEQEEEQQEREWDDDVLNKVDQDWSVFDRDRNKMSLRFREIDDIIDRGKVEQPKEDLQPYFDKEIDIGKEYLESDKKSKKYNEKKT